MNASVGVICIVDDGIPILAMGLISHHISGIAKGTSRAPCSLRHAKCRSVLDLPVVYLAWQTK